MKINTLKILLAICFVVTGLSTKAADETSFVTYDDKKCCREKYSEVLSRESGDDLKNSTEINLGDQPLVLQIHKMRNFDGDNGKYTKKYKKAAERLIFALNSDAFASALKNVQDLTETEINGQKILKPEQILVILRSGMDSINIKKDGDVDIDVTLYWNPLSKVVGYTYPPRTWVNKKYLKTMTHNELAGHILHEYLAPC